MIALIPDLYNHIARPLISILHTISTTTIIHHRLVQMHLCMGVIPVVQTRTMMILHMVIHQLAQQRDTTQLNIIGER